MLVQGSRAGRYLSQTRLTTYLLITEPAGELQREDRQVFRHLLSQGLRRVVFVAVLAAASIATAAALAPSTHARPAYQLCSNTHAVAVGTSHNNYSYGSVWVTLDKLMDNVQRNYFCGSVRVHAQVRLGAYQPSTGASPWHIIGTLYYGPDVYHLNWKVQTPTATVPRAGSGGETVDTFSSPWSPGTCGQVSALFEDNHPNWMGDSGIYTGCA
jgi:hypothetical protein